MEFTTADLADRFPMMTAAIQPMLRHYGATRTFGGQIVTVEVYDDNGLIYQALSQPGAGKVLVVDGGGSLRAALVGQQLIGLAYTNKWAGIVVYGCIRDSRKLSQAPLGIAALDTHPVLCANVGAGAANVMVSFGNATIHPGYYLYADEDGFLVAESRLVE